MNYTNPDDGNSLFYAELYKLLDNDSDAENDSNKCLISDEILVDKFVKLPCGHSFNYIPLYNDIKNHKTKFNHMEASVSKLLIHEIRCPYCRSIHESLLPYYEDFDLAKIHGVNWLDPTHDIVKIDKVCSFVCYVPENPTNCLCTYGMKVNLFDKQIYCYYHNKDVNTTHVTQMKEVRQKAKEAKQKVKDEKQKVKDEKQKVKDEKQKTKDEKQKTKDEKQKTKDAKQKTKDEKQKVKDAKQKTLADSQNVIESLITIEEENVVVTPLVGCIAVLKTGACKGKACNKKVYNDAMCKLHYCIYLK
jgi:hypothetical protein